ncbi:YceI family protein [Flavobacterium sp. SM15]|uniref:YceI family protein n=1 Tax=Flavobacterium sp. SM15 TaxID=2908005 RepID=UPI001EDB9AA5|nr:YceI family protein [Flavobacterium sp. SM15]MCG2610496.1 YceI family protein [Flavobacterium sp. SM15]
MKNILLLFSALLFVNSTFSQEKKITKTGEINFEASVPSFEEVKAKSKSVTFVLNTETGDIAALALIKGFRFKIALMEEHFNENYIESDKYPKATFKGKVYGFDMTKLSETSKDFSIKGNLELHGKSKEITVPAKIKKTADGIEIVSNFSVNSDDFNIQIPKVVSNKVSKKVNISLDCVLK